MSNAPVEISIIGSLSLIAGAEWDACACPEATDGGRPADPFTTHRFLGALEDSGSLGPGTGWSPCHLIARQGKEVIAVAPLYAKTHSQGEYVFDHAWAHAYEQAGGAYYPKLQLAVPFTPVTGRRFLAAPGHEATGMAALMQGAAHLAGEHGLSSVHVTFCTGAEAAAATGLGWLHRTGQQFHWQNDGYACFDAYLAALSSRKRKNIRKERQAAQAFGGTIHRLTGDRIRPEHWRAFWHFYQDTGARKWGHPYLTRAFFDLAQERLRDDILLIMAERGGRWVAGAMNLIGRDALYGRYWGCAEHHPCLHFELCYYQAMEAAMAMGLSRVEAGAQGGHKLARGYMPVTTHSLHWIADPGFRRAAEAYLQAERRAVDDEIGMLNALGPFRSEQ